MGRNTHSFDNQDSYLYDIQWTKEVDDVFVDVFCYEAQHGNFVYGQRNLPATVMAIDSLWHRCKVMCTKDQCAAKLDKLFKRYTTVSWMMSLPHVKYDAITNDFKAPQHTWEFIVQSNPFALAYRVKGDPKWLELCDIFGPQANRDTEVNNNVIVLSSEDSGDDDNSIRQQHAQLHGLNPPAVHQNVSHGSSRLRSALSRNVQTTMWDYFGYISDSDQSRETVASTAHSKPKDRRHVFVHAVPSPKPPIPNPSPPMPMPQPSNSTGSSSCASNDTYGRRGY